MVGVLLIMHLNEFIDAICDFWPFPVLIGTIALGLIMVHLCNGWS